MRRLAPGEPCSAGPRSGPASQRQDAPRMSRGDLGGCHRHPSPPPAPTTTARPTGSTKTGRTVRARRVERAAAHGPSAASETVRTSDVVAIRVQLTRTGPARGARAWMPVSDLVGVDGSSKRRTDVELVHLQDPVRGLGQVGRGKERRRIEVSRRPPHASPIATPRPMRPSARPARRGPAGRRRRQ